MSKAGTAAMSEEILNAISELAFFNEFEPQELNIIASHLSLRDLAKGEAVFTEGDKGNYMCFISQGTLNIVKDIDGKRDVIISTISRGKSIGEMAMVDHSPRSATAIAAKDTVLIIMGRQAFDLILERHPKIGVKLLSGVARLLSLHLRMASGRLADKLAT